MGRAPACAPADKTLGGRMNKGRHTNLLSTGFVRQSQLLQDFIPFSPATLWRKVKSGEFPRPVKLSTRITAWRTEDVLAWIEAHGSAAATEVQR